MLSSVTVATLVYLTYFPLAVMARNYYDVFGHSQGCF